VCPYNIKFAQELGEPAFAARATIESRDARALARDLLAMDDESFRSAFKGSPMKRAKRRGLERNAAVVLGNVGDDTDLVVLAEALETAEPLVREHLSWALAQIEARKPSPVIG